MQDLLRSKLVQQDALVSNGDFFHIRCCSHILNLVVQDGLKVIGKTLEKVRNSVRYVEGSESRMLKFKQCVRCVNLDESKGLWYDVPTRWNLTYLMLERFLYYYNASAYLAVDDAHYGLADLPSREELDKIKHIFGFLKPFYDITTLFSGTSYPTANLYFDSVCKIKLNMMKEIGSSNSFLQTMARSMKQKFDKYWDNYSLVLTFAFILDPRFKLKFIRFSLNFFYDDYEAKTKDILDRLKSFLKEYENASRSIKVTREQLNERELDESLQAFECYDSDHSIASPCKPKIQVTVVAFDILGYWKDNHARYPHLSLLARDVLSIPITTIASKSTFSIGGRVLNKWRSSLSSKNAKVLITTRNWLYGYEDFDDEEVKFEANGGEINIISRPCASEVASNSVD